VPKQCYTKFCASSDHLDLFLWGVSLLCPISAPAFWLALEGAARVGRLDVLESLNEKSENNRSRRTSCWKYRGEAATAAAAGGQVDVLEWLERNGYEGFAHADWSAAAISGKYEVLEWRLRKELGPDSKSIALGLARKGDLKKLQWVLADMKCLWDNQVVSVAAEEGPSFIAFLYVFISSPYGQQWPRTPQWTGESGLL
jgi:hypothetical protein